MRDLMDEDGENRAIRTFLQVVYGGTKAAVSTDYMREHLEVAGWENHTPDWAKTNQTLTKAGVQLWLRFLISLEPTCPFVVGQKVDLKSPAVWECSEDQLRNGFTITAVEPDEKLDSGFRIQVRPSVIPCVSNNDQAWCDADHFIEKKYPVIEKGNWPVIPAKFAQHQTLLNVQTKQSICVTLTPDRCRIEATGEPAYAYHVWDTVLTSELREPFVRLGSHTPDKSMSLVVRDLTESKEIFVCSQTEMESGRFVLCDQNADSGNGIGPQTQAAIDSLKTETYLPKDNISKGNISFVDEQAALNDATPFLPPTESGGEE